MTLACRLIRASHLAYAICENEERLVDPLPTPGELEAIGCVKSDLAIRQPAGREYTDAFLFGRTLDNAYILAFRGTLDRSDPGGDEFFRVLLDWLGDGNIALCTGGEMAGRVHRGFLDSLDHLWSDVEQLLSPAVQAEIRSGTPLYVTGHSKGGAVAQLAAYRLARQGVTPAAVHTFAAPRSGNAEFAAAFDATFPAALRFEYRDDMVPHLPAATGAWVSVLRGLRAINLTFPVETAQVTADSRVSHALEDLLARLESDLPTYASCGQLQFIDWDDKIQPDSRELTIQRNLSLAKKLAELKLSEVIGDHGSQSGYGRVLCAG